MAKRLGPRFGLEAGFLIGVAVVLGLLEVSWQGIVAAMALAWLLVAAVEIVLAREPQPTPAEEPTPMAVPAEPVHVPPVIAPPPPVVGEPEPEPEPEEPAAPEPAPTGEAREWNIWELERIAHEHAGVDPTRDEERSFLLLSLRDHARPDGTLPAQFDLLVREAFGDVLRTPA